MLGIVVLNTAKRVRVLRQLALQLNIHPVKEPPSCRISWNKTGEPLHSLPKADEFRINRLRNLTLLLHLFE